MGPPYAVRRSPPQAKESKESKEKDVKRLFQPYHAIRVPKEVDLHSASAQQHQGGFCEEKVTTLMLRNIPNKYTQSVLLQEIDNMGFAGTYDFFYLPMDVHNRSNVGYAFINFVEPFDATRCTQAFSNYKFPRYHSKKICAVSPAHIQGFEKNVQHFKHRAVMNARDNQYRPIVLRGGQKIELDDNTQLPIHCEMMTGTPKVQSYGAPRISLAGCIDPPDGQWLSSVPYAPAMLPLEGMTLPADGVFDPSTLQSFEQAICALRAGNAIPADDGFDSAARRSLEQASEATVRSGNTLPADGGFDPTTRQSFEQAICALLQNSSMSQAPAQVFEEHTASFPSPPPGLNSSSIGDVEETPRRYTTQATVEAEMSSEKPAMQQARPLEDRTPRTNRSLLDGVFGPSYASETSHVCW